MQSVLSDAHYHNEEAAYAFVEAMLWPDGPTCPHCGNADAEKIGKLQGKTTRIGLYKCYACREPFNVKIGTVFEKSHVPMRIWLQAIYLMSASKKGVSTRQLQRTLQCGMKTAWFLGHRIREMMSDSGGTGPLGSGGAIVEADETFITRSPKTRKPKDAPRRETRQVLSLVERGGPIRSKFLDHNTVRSALRGQLAPDAQLRTDMSMSYQKIMPWGQHEAVDHSKGEYVRGDAHTNTLEGFFSVFKRGLIGVYQHVDVKHLDRYLAEFDFRFNNRAKLGIDDTERAARAIAGAKGKRLTYATSRQQEALDTPPF
jgi:transposase-like protein